MLSLILFNVKIKVVINDQTFQTYEYVRKFKTRTISTKCDLLLEFICLCLSFLARSERARYKLSYTISHAKTLINCIQWFPFGTTHTHAVAVVVVIYTFHLIESLKMFAIYHDLNEQFFKMDRRL